MINFGMIYILILMFSIATTIQSEWIESIIFYELKTNNNISIHHTFNLYSNLTQHPLWSPWITNVVYDEPSGISIWTLKKFGLTYSWNAKNTILKPPYIIQWESISGLQNKGKVEFFTSSSSSSSSSSSPLLTSSTMYTDECSNDNRRMDCVSDDNDSYDVSTEARTDSRNDNKNNDNDDDDDDDDIKLLYTYKTLLDDINYQRFKVKNQLNEQQLNSYNDNIDNNTSSNNNNNNSNNDDTNNDNIIIMKMTISYELPDIVAFLLKGMGSIATDFIDKTLTKDLQRFDKILKSKYEVM